MQVASVTTDEATLRSEIGGWTYEDSALFQNKEWRGGLFIGYTPSPKNIPQYKCILHMLADKWKLLGPPTREEFKNNDGETIVQYGWWLTRD